MRVWIMAARGEESAEGQRGRERDARNNANRNPTYAPLGHVGVAVTTIYLERREPARNRLRFYAINVTRTLFDDWALVGEWGRLLGDRRRDTDGMTGSMETREMLTLMR